MKNENKKQPSFKQNGKLLSNPVLGFYSISDLINTIFAPASGKLITIMALLGGVSSFISGYIYNDSKAVLFLLAILGVDAISGMWNAIKKGTFSSTRMPRILLTMVSYFLILGMATNIAKYTPDLNFLPGVCYTSFITIVSVSVLENLNELGLISQNIVDIFKSKVHKD